MTDTTKPSAFVEENPPAEETKSAKSAQPKPKRATPKKATSGRPSKRDSVARNIEELLDGAGMALMLMDPGAGVIIREHSQPVAEAWADLADKDPKVMRAIERLFKTGAYTQVTLATLGLILPLLAHYNLIPSGLFNPLGMFSGGEDGSTDATVGAV